MQSRMIRLFVSSTFQNFEEERNRLAAYVYPELETLCRKNGFSFHVIDLRWGVSKEDVAENQSAQICFDEIRRCQELSPQLNFLIMAGDRYGWKPLPVEISKEEWGILTEDEDCDSQLKNMMKSYYRQDLNSLDEKYILRPADDAGRAAGEKRFHRLLERQARKKLPEAAARKYSTSATEQEIQLGYLDADKYRENTFLMLKKNGAEAQGGTASGTKQEPKGMRRKARKLRKKLRRTAENQKVPDQVCEYEPGDLVYLEQAKSFLKRVIKEQIEAGSRQSEFEIEQDVLDHMYRSNEAGFIELPWHEEAARVCEGRAGSPVFLVGASGSGKSSFLKHFAHERERRKEKTAVIFNDTQPERRLLFPALEFLADSLEKQGVLEKEIPSSEQIRRPVAWFEKQLQKISADEPVTVILDSVDNISDYRKADKGLFQMSLPSCVTLIVSAKSEQSLLQTELDAARLCALSVRELSGKEGAELLRAMLARRGRCMQPDQMTAAQKNIPDQATALDIELFAQICQKLHSWSSFPYAEILSFEELVQKVLFQKDRKTYRVFRTHALCFLALAFAGLTEAELIDLLSMDQDVVEEIRGQTEWRFRIITFEERENASEGISTYTGKIPVVLWAMFYAEIKNLLSNFSDHGVSLMQYRHVRLKQCILEIIPEEERRQALQIMSAYFGAKWQEWLLRDEDRITANRRKVSELFPLYEQLGEYDAIRRKLEDLLCLDAFVRCGMLQNIRGYLEKYASSSGTMQILELLREKDLLFRLWPETFLQSVLPELRLRQDEKEDVQEKKKLLLKAGQKYLLLSDGISLSKDGVFFPQLKEDSQFAVNDEGMAAVCSDGILRIIDMKQQIFTETVCFTVTEECFLYWKDDRLFVRCAKKRLSYRLCGEQLAECSREKCPDWGNLIQDNKVSKGGGAAEAEGFRTTTQQGSVRYFEEEQPLHTHLFYSGNTELHIRTRGTLAAIVLADGTKLEVVDLKHRKVILRETYSVITGVEWSPSGRKLLIILRGNTLLCLEIDPHNYIDELPGPKETYQKHLIRTIADGVEDAGKTLYEAASMDAGAVVGRNAFARQLPLFGALSMKYGWFACYYNKDGNGKLQLYDLRQKPYRKKECETDSIRMENAVRNPLYPACGRNGLILAAGRRTMLLDIEKKRWMAAPDSSLRPERPAPELVKNYIHYMETRMNLKKPPAPETDQKKEAAHRPGDPGQKSPMQGSDRKKGLLQRLLPSRKENRISRRDYQAYLPYLRLCSSELLECGTIRWLIDRHHGIILAYDTADVCVYHDMIRDRILAADTFEEKLYLLTERTDQIIEMELIPCNS